MQPSPDPASSAPEQTPGNNAHLEPPFVQIEGILNCRFLPLPSARSGTENLNTSSGSKHKPSIFRSADISRITPRGAEQLRALGIRTIFDLRSDPDVVQFASPAPVIDGVDIIRAPVLAAPAPGEAGEWYGNDNLRKVYREFLEDEQGAFMRQYTKVLEEGKEEIAKILRHLISRPGDGVLLHCNGGKDRTGVLAALLLLLAGQEDTTIVHDYTLTATGFAPMASVLLKSFAKAEAFQEYPEGAMNLFSSRAITMQNFLELIRTKYGGAEAYVRDVAGLSQTEVDTLKEVLIK